MQVLKDIIKYLIFFLIGIFFLKIAFRGFDFKELKEGIKNSKYIWLIFAFISNIISHIFRAYRWKYLILPLNYNPSIFNLFISDLSGLFMNLFLPRLGEIFRCTTLKRLENVNVIKSLTSVIIERSLDVVVFFLISLSLFFFYPEKLKTIIGLIPLKKILLQKNNFIVITLILTFIILIIFALKYLLKRYLKKLKEIFTTFIYNFKIILNNDKKTIIGFLSFLVWLFYFLSVYLVFFSIKETSHLKIDAGLIILIASSLGLSAPIQGSGAGAVHLFVVYAFTLFFVPKNIGLLSATLIHFVQFIAAVIPGGLSMILSFFLSRAKS